MSGRGEGTRLPGSAALVVSFMALFFLLRSAGGMPARMGSMSVGVGFIAPKMVRRASLIAASSFLVCRLSPQAGEAYSAVEKTRARAEVRKVLKSAPQSVPASFLMRLTRERVFAVTFCRCWLKVRSRTFCRCWVKIRLGGSVAQR